LDTEQTGDLWGDVKHRPSNIHQISWRIEMGYYYLNNNQQPSGDYEVHTTECTQGADPENQLNLGWHADCYSAVAKAKQSYPNVASNINGCYYCCEECHTS
jgi:hypothetical protein